MRFFKSATLSTRLTKVIALLTFCLFFLFSLITFFIAYSLEDAMFNQQLQQANQQLQHQKNLPLQVKKIADLTNFGLTLSSNKQFLEFNDDDLFGEFSHNNKHYHYMKVTDGLLLMDVSEQVVVKRGAKDILLILLLVFIPCMLLSIYIAKALSTHALKPFNRLCQHFQQKSDNQDQQFANSNNIEEADVRAIAEQLEQALEKQEQLIAEQIAFNQGMSHEIRTPLQVMTHSLELIEENSNEFYQQPSVQRLVKSLARIKRTSNALLWLTSKEQYQDTHCVTQVMEKLLVESKNLATIHHLDLCLKSENSLKVAIPQVVLELIFLNLINNVINHGVHCNDIIKLVITINTDNIVFSNEVAGTSSKQQHFNLGLNLITKLAQRFNSNFTTKVIDNQFNAILSFD